ncbi:site-specific integrase [Mycolicibacterium vanbaalenii]|uniref:tyrosine-type recombinase/integrase n=1 Tax=Mycolicibacterium vanbaalenii TaxID=110539 RepID=UPI001F2BB6CF|nr:site-specific integrase [Mycolicibacterium vanbaalenii]UJL28866.1 site-specific integrase [Mycolicibacterium vanbaalenii]WND55580.1 site-specific integrase [Mycolicibacterium vanbaalenii]
MAYVRAHGTKQRRNGKVVKTYAVVWREAVRDEFGLPTGATRARRETYPTRDAAEARRDELNAAKHTYAGTSALAEQRAKGEQPFGFYARAWLDAQAVRVASGKVKQRTVDEYERQLHTYVLGELGSLAVAAVTPAHLEKLLTGLVRKQSRQGDRKAVTPGTVKHIWDVVRRVLRYAVQHGALDANPADRVDFSASRATGDHAEFEHHPLTAAEVGALSAAVAGYPPAGYDGPALPAYPVYGLLVEFLAYTGLRAAEAAGLEVGDLLFGPGPTCAVRVARTKDRKNGVWVVGTPKSKRSRRTMPLPPWLARRMADYLAEVHPRANEPTAPLWPSRKNGGGYRAAGERYAVPLDWSQPLALGTFYDTILKPALEAVGLPASRPATKDAPAVRGVRLHDLRHTFAVLQLSAGTHFMQVSKWLGHSTYTLTLDVYGDYIPEQDGGAANNLPEPPAPVRPCEAAGNVVPLRREG